MVTVTLVGSPELAIPKPDDADEIPSQNALFGGIIHISGNVSGSEAHKIKKAKAFVDIELLESNCFPLVAVINSPGGLMVHVHNFSFRNILNLVALIHRPACPIQVFQAR